MNAPTYQGFIFSYYYDISTQTGKTAYDEMVTTIPVKKPSLALPLQYKNPFKIGDYTGIEIETNHLFENQFDEKDFGRLFDWKELKSDNPAIKTGYFLLENPGLQYMRDNFYKCAYCGKISDKSLRFCQHCLGSEYLKPENLSLLLLKPINSALSVQPLNEKEQALLELLYKTAQHKTHVKRAKRILDDKRARIKKAIADSKIEIAGFEWFLNRGINTDNLIYYSHAKVFTFGWRSAVEDTFCNRLLEIVSEFPFQYEIIAQRGNFTNKV